MCCAGSTSGFHGCNSQNSAKSVKFSLGPHFHQPRLCTTAFSSSSISFPSPSLIIPTTICYTSKNLNKVEISHLVLFCPIHSSFSPIISSPDIIKFCFRVIPFITTFYNQSMFRKRKYFSFKKKISSSLQCTLCSSTLSH